MRARSEKQRRPFTTTTARAIFSYSIVIKSMNYMEEKLQRIKDIVEEELSCSAHNIEHVMRVYNLCLSLAKDEPKIDLFILKTSALLHDIARVKEDEDDTGMTDHAVLGAEMAGKILTNLGYTSEQIVKIKH